MYVFIDLSVLVWQSFISMSLKTSVDFISARFVNSEKFMGVVKV